MALVEYLCTYTPKLQTFHLRIRVTNEDFLSGLQNIVPAAQRSAVIYASPIPVNLRPLLSGHLEGTPVAEREVNAS